MLAFIEALRKEWHMIKVAPFSFIIVCILIIAGCFAGFSTYYRSKLADGDNLAALWKSRSDYWEDVATHPKPVEANKTGHALPSPQAPPLAPLVERGHHAISASEAKPVSKASPNPAPAVINAPGGIPIIGGNVNNPTVINNAPPPANLNFTEEVITPFSETGGKFMKVHIKTDRIIPGAVVGIVFSDSMEMSKGNGPDDPTFNGSGAFQLSWGYPLARNQIPIPNSMYISVNIPAAFTPGQELIVPVRSKTDVHVIQVGPIK
jgi:hypothetical protein